MRITGIDPPPEPDCIYCAICGGPIIPWVNELTGRRVNDTDYWHGNLVHPRCCLEADGLKMQFEYLLESPETFLAWLVGSEYRVVVEDVLQEFVDSDKAGYEGFVLEGAG